jgi:hypothetical protein
MTYTHQHLNDATQVIATLDIEDVERMESTP